MCQFLGYEEDQRQGALPYTTTPGSKLTKASSLVRGRDIFPRSRYPKLGRKVLGATYSLSVLVHERKSL